MTEDILLLQEAPNFHLVALTLDKHGMNVFMNFIIIMCTLSISSTLSRLFCQLIYLLRHPHKQIPLSVTKHYTFKVASL